ncbi:hypothetical protein [Amphibacillus sp. MSJ-3]|nr:hypothetical protein [Amphibacillus sp. MSJ-3]
MGDQLTVAARLVQGPLGHTLVVLTSVFSGTSNRSPIQWWIGE